MKIQEVVIKEFKGVKDFEFKLDGKSVLIQGENSKGKTTVMQFIQIALGKTSDIPPNATGEGVVVADKNGKEYTFQVKFKDSKPQLRVIAPDGMVSDRKGVIGSIVGAIEFDIHAFVEMSKTRAGRKEQVEIFKKMLPADVIVEIKKFEDNIDSMYNDRTDINKQLTAVKGKIELHEFNRIGAKDPADFKLIPEDEIRQKYANAISINQKRKEVSSRIDDRTISISRNDAEIEILKQKIADLETQNSDMKFKNDEATKWLAANPEIDQTEIESEITKCNENNEKYKLAQEFFALQKEKKELEEISGNKTVLIETERQLLSDTIKDCSMEIVPGLTFDSDNLLYNGFPVDDSTLAFSEIAELGVRMKLAENPELPLFISNGESIGNERFELIKSIAKANDLQIIMEEMVRGKDELHIEFIAE